MKIVKNRETIRKLFEILESDFYKSLDDSAEYIEITNRRNFNEEILKNCVNAEQYKLFNVVSEIESELAGFFVEEAFLAGFKTAYDLYRDTL